MDLFSLFHQAVDFVQKLEWPNSLQECRFNTALSKVIGVAIEQYTNRIEEAITTDIYPRTNKERRSITGTTLLDRARSQITGSRAHSKAHEEPYDFLAEVIIPL